MIFRQLNKTSCKTYLIGSENTKEVIVVDPVLEQVSEYISLIKKEGLKLTHVLDTHTHADHISGAGALADQMGAVYVMHQNSPVRCVAFRVPDGFDCHLSDMPVKVMHTPGHTKDSMCLIFSDRILTGDSLFLDDGGAGRTDLPGGDPGEHWESIQKIMKLSDRLIVYPAHEYRGREPSSLGEQKKRNPNLQPRTKEAYIKWLTDMKLGTADWMKDVLKANYACARDHKAAWIPVDAPACEIKGTMAPGVNEQQVPTIPVAEVKRRIADNRLGGTVILDVREPAELTGELGAIKDVLNIPVGQITQKLNELEKYKEKEFITVCRSGGRAHTAAAILLKAGFKKVFNMSGGMTAYRQAEKPR
jgi:glyoxylase-like metal-dependent hydrolase (beta-lactamase superfamily II)/rhodanese-related sulfurtransferase